MFSAYIQRYFSHSQSLGQHLVMSRDLSYYIFRKFWVRELRNEFESTSALWLSALRDASQAEVRDIGQGLGQDED